MAGTFAGGCSVDRERGKCDRLEMVNKPNWPWIRQSQACARLLRESSWRQARGREVSVALAFDGVAGRGAAGDVLAWH
jgi:hypothetical protein